MMQAVQLQRSWMIPALFQIRQISKIVGLFGTGHGYVMDICIVIYLFIFIIYLYVHSSYIVIVHTYASSVNTTPFVSI